MCIYCKPNKTVIELWNTKPGFLQYAIAVIFDGKNLKEKKQRSSDLNLKNNI